MAVQRQIPSDSIVPDKNSIGCVLELLPLPGTVRFVPCWCVLSMCCLLSISAAAAAERYEVLIDRNVPAKMSDGVVLRADVFRPKAEGRFPVLLERTPYNKDGNRDFFIGAAGRGYVVVVQDCRGRFASEGEWYPFKNESQDGYDTIEWAAQLPYSNGKVGLIEGSYMGATQMLAAISHPPHLVGLLPLFTPSDYHDGWVYQGGALSCGSTRLGRRATWRPTT